MIFKRFYDDNLAQASYLIACERTREAIVVDPSIDVGQYTRAAGAERLHIAHVTETHIHADYLSGARDLADTTGAALHLSAEGGEFGYTAAALDKANALRAGSHIYIGDVLVTARHTPGHTPEHLTFFLSDRARGDTAVGALTGDFVFVGDVGRPDLLEKAAGVAGTMEDSARQLFESLGRMKKEPDHLQIWPGHGAGSACGKSLGAMPQTTLGYERLFNWAFAEMSEREFVERVLENQPVPPRYFATMKRRNRDVGRPRSNRDPERRGFTELENALNRACTVLDTRTAEKFAAGHVPGTLNIPLGKSFLNWVGALAPDDSEVYLIVDSESDEAVKQILADLCKIGMTNIAAYFGSGLVQEWKTRRGALNRVEQLEIAGFRDRGNTNGLQLIDVRSPDEWSHGHLPGSIHIPLAALPDRLDEIDPSRPVVLQCRGGGRSSIASSLLMSRGLTNVANLKGGYDGWVAEGLPTELPAESERKSSR